MFVYLLSGSLNFSTRQLNPLTEATWFQTEQLFCSLPSPPARWQRYRPINASLRSQKKDKVRGFTPANYSGFNRFLFSSHRCFRLSLRVSAERIKHVSDVRQELVGRELDKSRWRPTLKQERDFRINKTRWQVSFELECHIDETSFWILREEDGADTGERSLYVSVSAVHLSEM
ncbi:Hypothetical predicted protein [Scomber scombrus]|uniref:Uncharacterized protein n=1 Tax=Scomber scombrus TaxID=13677 RepID=A0AAV1NIS9_SCOSC